MFESELAIAIAAAKEAGAAIMTYYNTNVEVTTKENDTPVTKADHAANDIILAHLSKTDYPILSEETEDDLSRLDADAVWIVDPLDGTKSFIAGDEGFAVLIGLAYHGKPVLGVMYQPTLDKLTYGVKDQGAYLQIGLMIPRKIHVSDEEETSALTVVKSTWDTHTKYTHIANALGISKMAQSGGIGVKIGLIAEGIHDVYYNTNRHLGEWDTCAPSIILTEAGGHVTDTHGKMLWHNQKDIYRPNGVLATNGPCHAEIVEAITSVLNQ